MRPATGPPQAQNSAAPFQGRSSTYAFGVSQMRASNSPEINSTQERIIRTLQENLEQTKALLSKERTIRTLLHSAYEEKLADIDTQFQMLVSRIESDAMTMAILTRERDEALAQVSLSQISIENLKLEFDRKSASLAKKRPEIEKELSNLALCANSAGTDLGRQIMKIQQSLSSALDEQWKIVNAQPISTLRPSISLVIPQFHGSTDALSADNLTDIPVISEIVTRLAAITSEMSLDKRMADLYKYLEEHPFHKLINQEGRVGTTQNLRRLSSVRSTHSQPNRANPNVSSADSQSSHERIVDLYGQMQLLETRLRSEISQKDVLLAANVALEKDLLKQVRKSEGAGSVQRDLMDAIEQQSLQYQRLRSLIQEENMQLHRHIEFLQSRLGEEMAHKERNLGTAHQLQLEISGLMKILDNSIFTPKATPKAAAFSDSSFDTSYAFTSSREDDLITKYTALNAEHTKILSENSKLMARNQDLQKKMTEIWQPMSRYNELEKLRAELATKTVQLEILQQSFETAMSEKKLADERFSRLAEDTKSFLEVVRDQNQTVGEIQSIRQALQEERNIRQSAQTELARVLSVMASVCTEDDTDFAQFKRENTFSSNLFTESLDRELFTIEASHTGNESEKVILEQKVDHLKKSLLLHASARFKSDQRLESAQRRLLKHTSQLESLNQEIERLRRDRAAMETEYKNLVKLLDDEPETENAPRSTGNRSKTPTKTRSRTPKRSLSCGKIRSSSVTPKDSKEDSGSERTEDEAPVKREPEVQPARSGTSTPRTGLRRRDSYVRVTRASIKKQVQSTPVTISPTIERVISEDFEGIKRLFDSQLLIVIKSYESVSEHASTIQNSILQGMQRIEEFKAKTKGKKSTTIEFLEECFNAISSHTKDIRATHSSLPTIPVLRVPFDEYVDGLTNKCRALYRQMAQFKVDRQEFKDEAAALGDQFDIICGKLDDKTQAYNDLEIQLVEVSKELQELKRAQSFSSRLSDQSSSMDSSFQNRGGFDGWSSMQEPASSPDRMVLQMQTIVSENAQQLRLAHEEIQQLREENTALWMDKDHRIDTERLQVLLHQLSEMKTALPTGTTADESVSSLLLRQRNLIDMLERALREKFDLRRLLRPQPFLARQSMFTATEQDHADM